MNKINFGIHNKNFISKKMLIGPMVAGSLLCGSLSSCTNKPDTFKTNKIEYVNENKNKNPNLIISDNLELKNNVEKKRGAISGFKYVSKNDSSGKDFGKRISVGIIGGIIGGLIGTFKRGAGKGGTIGATAGVLFPGIFSWVAWSVLIILPVLKILMQT